MMKIAGSTPPAAAMDLFLYFPQKILTRVRVHGIM
jgi:hypothetical protein